MKKLKIFLETMSFFFSGSLLSSVLFSKSDSWKLYLPMLLIMVGGLLVIKFRTKKII